MTKPIDETMSQEQAFETTQAENTFAFDDDKAPEDTTTKEVEESEEDTDSATPEDKTKTVDDESDDESEQKVPYSRFKKVLDERDSTQSTIQLLEERLAQLEKTKIETTDPSDIEVPQEWKDLYGDNDLSKKAFLIQLKREEQIQEKAVQTAIERLKREQDDNAKRLTENEETIDKNLSSLSEKLGKKLSTKQEEDILSIVDEFSPVGEDGKYVSLFPFDKAYEIYTLRNGVKTKVVQKQRTAVSDLSNNQSEGETDNSSNTFQRGWDSWQKEL